MGAWGTAIFSDDFACDVRDDYVKQIIKGKTNEEAVQYVMDKSLPNEDDEDYPVFWIALAITQWKKGRLLSNIKEKALIMIENGIDLERWKTEPQKVFEKRRQVLEKAKATLLSPMPAAKKIPMPSWMRDDPWQLGDIISYRITKEDIEYPEFVGKYVLLRIAEVGVFQQDGPKSNFYAVFNRYWDRMPVESDCHDLSYLKLSEYHNKATDSSGYVTCEYISIDKRDINEHEMSLIKQDKHFIAEQSDFFKNGSISGVLSNPYVFDDLLSRLLHENVK